MLGGGAHADGGMGPGGVRTSGPTRRWRPRAASVSSQGPWLRMSPGLVQGVRRLSQSEAERNLPWIPPRRPPRTRPEPAHSEWTGTGRVQPVLQPPVEPAQYTSHKFLDHLKSYGIRPSVGRTGACWDNAWAESFNAHSKREGI